MKKIAYRSLVLAFILFLFLQMVNIPSKSFIKSEILSFYGNSSILSQKINGKKNLFFIDFYTNRDSLKDFFRFTSTTGEIFFIISIFLICGVIGVFRDINEKIFSAFLKNIGTFWKRAILLFLIYLPIFVIFLTTTFLITKSFLLKNPSLGKILPYVLSAFASVLMFFVVRFFYTISKVALIKKNLSPFKSFIYPFKHLRKIVKKPLLIYFVFIFSIGIFNLTILKLIGKGITSNLVYIVIELLIYAKFFIISATYGFLTDVIE